MHNHDQPCTTQVYRNAEGTESVCPKCLELGSQQRFLQKVTNFVLQMDMADLLFNKMFDPDNADEFVETLRKSANYERRHKANYEKCLEDSVEDLHQKVRCIWQSRMSASSDYTEALQLWYSHVVQPCLTTEPGQSIKQKSLQDLLRFMASDPTCTGHEIDLVRTVVSGELFRHPAMQGILVACLNQLRMMKSGAVTMRNPHRILSSNAQHSISVYHNISQ